MHAATHWPPVHFGVVPLHWASLEQVDCDGSIWQTPFVQVWPAPHVLESVQDATHWLSTQRRPLVPQSLENWQVFAGAVQLPPAHTSPFEQSPFDVQGQGPFVPPHAWQVESTQTAVPVQSAFVVHWIAPPASVPGALHAPAWHVVPFGQSLVCWQLFSQPTAVHTWPVGHCDAPVHAEAGGGVTVLQP